MGDTLLSQRQHSLDKELGSVGSKHASTAQFLLALLKALVFLKLHFSTIKEVNILPHLYPRHISQKCTDIN